MMRNLKKSHKIILIAVAFCIIVVGSIFAYNFVYVYFFSAEFKGGDSIEWNGDYYINASYKYEKGHRIGRAPRGYRIYSVDGDSELNFIYADAWTTQWKYVKEDYEIPTSGEITTVFIYDKKIKNEELIKTIDEIVNDEGEIFYFEPSEVSYDAIEIYVGYENCPVGTDSIGYIGFINDEWVFINLEESRDEESNLIRSYKIIDEKHIPILLEFPRWDWIR